jgi:hypothetical protein
MAEPPDRRKNPARKGTRRAAPRGNLGVIYLVEEDADSRWKVSRGGVPTGAFASKKDTAIGQAYAVATLEAKRSDLKVTVYSVEDGKRTKEWEST